MSIQKSQFLQAQLGTSRNTLALENAIDGNLNKYPIQIYDHTLNTVLYTHYLSRDEMQRRWVSQRTNLLKHDDLRLIVLEIHRNQIDQQLYVTSCIVTNLQSVSSYLSRLRNTAGLEALLISRYTKRFQNQNTHNVDDRLFLNAGLYCNAYSITHNHTERYTHQILELARVVTQDFYGPDTDPAAYPSALSSPLTYTGTGAMAYNHRSLVEHLECLARVGRNVLGQSTPSARSLLLHRQMQELLALEDELLNPTPEQTTPQSTPSVIG